AAGTGAVAGDRDREEPEAFGQQAFVAARCAVPEAPVATGADAPERRIVRDPGGPRRAHLAAFGRHPDVVERSDEAARPVVGGTTLQVAADRQAPPDPPDSVLRR